MGIEDPDADVAEQLASVREDDNGNADQIVLPVEADPADVAEQHTEIPDEDDYDH